MSSVKTTKTVQSLVLEMATSVFSQVTDPTAQGNASKGDMQAALDQLARTIDSKEAFDYLTAQDGLFARKIVSIVKACMKEVMADGRITSDDAPLIIKMVRDIADALNNVHDKTSAAVKIGVRTLVPLVEIVVCLACQMLLTNAEYVMAKAIVNLSFGLLQTTVYPLTKGCPWFCPIAP